jgi:pimeloyl-ACP methyl ester carboxylesterase
MENRYQSISFAVFRALRPSNDELWWLKQDLVDLEPRTENITSDVTIIHGTKDVLVPYSNITLCKKFVRNLNRWITITIERSESFYSLESL